MALTYLSTTNFHDASTQLLNKDVATHIAQFASPFENNGINKKKADSVFYNAMVISPSAEVYFLDTTGKVIAYHAKESDIRQWVLPLINIKKLIASAGKDYIKGPDPRDPENPKIFSASAVIHKSKNLGYIYVILGSNKDVSDMLYSAYFSSLLIKVFFVIIGVSIIFALIYLNRLQRSFNHMITILKKFQDGDFEARFAIKENDELAPVTTAFNRMADLVVYNINQLIKSEQERKDFVANISHDLRTPLSVARGYTETLLIKNEKQVTQQEEKKFLELIHRKLQQVEHMVKQLFDLSKMESAEFVPNKEPFIFSEILQEIIHALTSVASEKNIQISCIQCESTSWIFADVGMMERVIQNLLVNAINYTPEDGLINILLNKAGIELIFIIENSGDTLSPELLEWINNSAETNHTASRPAKSGIGLMIVKKILFLHEYSFKAEANTGIGNKFTIQMPVLQNES